MIIFMMVLASLSLVCCILSIFSRIVNKNAEENLSAIVYAALACGFFIAAGIWGIKKELDSLPCQGVVQAPIPPQTIDIQSESYGISFVVPID
jgi:hypothetical protein